MNQFDPPTSIPPDTVVSDKSFAQAPTLWHLPKDVWNDVWKVATGKTIKIAILDTGVTDHPDLPTPIAQKSFVGGETTDKNGHGTHCAGTALGRNGLSPAPEAELLVGKVLSDNGGGSSSGIKAGIDWAIKKGADIISLSLGSAFPHQPTLDAINRAWSLGIIVNAAAGNAGYNGRRNTIGWPAKGEDCICSGAINQDGKPAPFSSGGKEMDWVLPGQDIVSCSNTGGGYVAMSGTSMSCPMGSGFLALILELMRREGNKQWTSIKGFRDFIAANSDDRGRPGHDNRTGYGIPLYQKIAHKLSNEELRWL